MTKMRGSLLSIKMHISEGIVNRTNMIMVLKEKNKWVLFIFALLSLPLGIFPGKCHWKSPEQNCLVIRGE